MEGNSQIENLLLPDGWYALVIFLIIILSGLLGGFAAYYLNKAEGKSIKSEGKSIIKSLILGVVASFIVPLFLNMISSNLLIEAQRNIIKIYIFIGFCILASVFSKNFLENMYNKILQQMSDLKKDIAPIKEASNEPDIPTGDISEESLNQKGINKIEYDLLTILSMGKFTYRSIPGLKKEPALKEKSDLVGETINNLLAKKLIEPKHFENRQTERYFISSEGRKILGELSIEENNNA